MNFGRLAIGLACLSSLAAAQNADDAVMYAAPFQALNPAITGDVSGEASFREVNGKLLASIQVSGVAPDTMHLQHLHGSRDFMESRCPPAAADTNDDGLIDLAESRAYSGITLIPLHDDPVSLQIKTHTYPTANQQGSYEYQHSIDLSKLQTAVKEKYGMDELNPGRMVVYVHSVTDKAKLPDSVRSLPDVPAKVTLPIACAELNVQGPTKTR
ncbi:hypothetical protein F6455_11895 [Proteobacteria bacterium 005FR1]|nr:hypothetical protein [Proteobacteria bacterium 005FR1]